MRVVTALLFLVFVAILAIQLLSHIPPHIKAKYLSIHAAANLCDSEVLRLLLQPTPNDPTALANQKDQFSWTPLMYVSYLASSEKCVDAIRVLVAAGARVGDVDEEGLTALHIAVRARAVSTVVELLAHGARLDVQSIDGSTPMTVAAYWGRLAEARVLVDTAKSRKLSVRRLLRTPDKMGRTPVMFAVLNGHKEMVNALIEWDKQEEGVLPRLIDHQDHEGRSVMMLVLSNPEWRPMLGRMETIKWLLSLGANVELQDHHGKSVLMHVVEGMQDKDAPHMLRLLVENSSPAFHATQNKDGRSVMDMVENNGVLMAAVTAAKSSGSSPHPEL